MQINTPSVKCAGSFMCPEVDITGIYHEWIYLHGICRWLKKYGNVRNNEARPTDIAEYICGWKGTVYIATLKQYYGLCKNMVCWQRFEERSTATTENICTSIPIY